MSSPPSSFLFSFFLCLFILRDADYRTAQHNNNTCCTLCVRVVCPSSTAWLGFSSVQLKYMLNMDVANIRSLMRKTQASILENGFLGSRIDDLKLVSVAVNLWF